MNPITHRPLSAITVAGIIFREQRFLLVEELIEGEIKLNQPAGHVEPGESLVEAAKREVLEETRYHFSPEALLGIYHSNPACGPRIMRVAIIGSVDPAPDPSLTLDAGIISTQWLSADEISARREDLRSPFVTRCIDDFLQGNRFDLDVLHSFTGIEK
ncbi:MAG: NUDIX hydrolase [Halothiobacillus sp.]|nr:NUDIX hydrolase [Halothiobacillus sp.]